MNQHVTNYIVIRENDIDGLCNVVSAYIYSGWQPLGGITIDKESRFLQAMVMYA